jgi:hypothetical protein
MTKKRKAELCDAILLKFNGNKTIYWRDLHGDPKLFNDIILDSDCDKEPTPDNKYFVIEPLLNFLVADGILRRKDQDIEGEQSLCLSDKGYSTMKDLKILGYVTLAKKERKKSIWTKVSGGIVVATFLILIYNTWGKKDKASQNFQPSTNTEQSNTPHLPQLDTNKQPAKKESLTGIDTPTKQLPRQTKSDTKKPKD